MPAAVCMPLLAREKRRLSALTGGAALRGDAAESILCAYLSLIALARVAVNAVWQMKGADPIVALAVVPLIFWEGREPHAANLAAALEARSHLFIDDSKAVCQTVRK